MSMMAPIMAHHLGTKFTLTMLLLRTTIALVITVPSSSSMRASGVATCVGLSPSCWPPKQLSTRARTFPLAASSKQAPPQQIIEDRNTSTTTDLLDVPSKRAVEDARKSVKGKAKAKAKGKGKAKAKAKGKAKAKAKTTNGRNTNAQPKQRVVSEEIAQELDEAVTILSSLTAMQGVQKISDRTPSLYSYSPGFWTPEEETPKETKPSEKDQKRTIKDFFRRRKQRHQQAAKETVDEQRNISGTVNGKTSMPLSTPEHYSDRIGRDMRDLAVSIASSVDEIWQWRTFCEDQGGLPPLLECIRDGTSSDEAFMTACRACRALRDICALSPEIAAVITEGVLRADAAWSVSDDSEELSCGTGGLMKHFCALLDYAKELDQREESHLRSHNKARGSAAEARASTTFRRRKKRKNVLRSLLGSKEVKLRCSLYVVQFLLAMALSSDAAVNVMQSTVNLPEAVLPCSSYARKEEARRWIRYPGEVVRKWVVESFWGKSSQKKRSARPFVAAASIGNDLTGQLQGAANKLLAALGYNRWVPKIPGQKGLRILCLDGGGSRGLAAVTTLNSIVNSMGGVEVSDSFDIIAGTSTGAIIAFLVGLRRESSKLAKQRYDSLIRKVFVKNPLSAPMMFFTTASYNEAPFMSIMKEILGDDSMLDSRADPAVPLVFGISSKMSSTPTHLCLFRNYNYARGEMPDAFVLDPKAAREELGLKADNFDVATRHRSRSAEGGIKEGQACAIRTGEGSRHRGSFRVLQRVALRASTAAPTVFKPVLLGDELYCDGGIVASNPCAVAIHEARTLFPDTPIELVVSIGTGSFVEVKNVPRIGWDGIIGQIVQSATDGEQTHHLLEDILGQGGTAKLGRSSVSKTCYYRLNPMIGSPDEFPIDGTDPQKLQELTAITERYMQQEEQQRKLKEIGDILNGKRGWRRRIPW